MQVTAEEEWLCRDGRRIPVAEMETSHILSCIRMIHRREYRWRSRYLGQLQEELRKRAAAAVREGRHG